MPCAKCWRWWGGWRAGSWGQAGGLVECCGNVALARRPERVGNSSAAAVRTHKTELPLLLMPQNVSAGNVDLRKAVQYGRSSQRQILVLLLVATLCLLFLDWFNS